MTSGRTLPARASTLVTSGLKSPSTTHAPSPRNLPPSRSPSTPTVTRIPPSTKSPRDAHCRPTPTPDSLRFSLFNPPPLHPAAPNPIRPRPTRLIMRLPASTAVAGLIDIAKPNSTLSNPPVLTTPHHQGLSHPVGLRTEIDTLYIPTIRSITRDTLLTGDMHRPFPMLPRRWKQVSVKNPSTTDLPHLLSTGVRPVPVFPKQSTVLGVSCRIRARRHRL